MLLLHLHCLSDSLEIMAHGRVEVPAPPWAQGTLKKNGANGFSQKPQPWQRDGQQCVQLKEEGLERGNINDLGK